MSKVKYYFNTVCFLFFFILIFTPKVLADVRLPSIIGSDMVLQQKMKVPVWGRANPGEKVQVKADWQWFGASTKADKDGEWMVKIKTPKAGGPHKIVIKGNNTIELENVLIGEVWFCSGQSNMQWNVRNSNNSKYEIAGANYQDIRLFTVPMKTSEKPVQNCKGSWQLCSSETIPAFSGAAYFFGREIHKELGVPVGLIHAGWGGSTAEAWTTRDVLESDEDFRPILQRYDEIAKNYSEVQKQYKEKLNNWQKNAAKAKAENRKIPPKPRDPLYPIQQKPSLLYNAMLSPIMPYGIRGVIWYQGEANARRAYQYRKLFPTMIENWRNDWGQGEFPFYYVQIAPFNRKDEKWAAMELREAQLMTLSLPNTGMVVTMDIGNVNDIHPKNKQDVGRRLSLWVLADTYGKKGIVCSGPIYKGMKKEGDKIRLFFDYLDGGLVASEGALTHFEIAGRDKNFVNAEANIDGDTVVVYNEKVSKPVAVRFGWSNTAVPNLYNRAGLPASPFRTDDWPGITFDER
ncbi:MAG: sialate O-acetylesterase [Planctomycetota bacterium]